MKLNTIAKENLKHVYERKIKAVKATVCFITQLACTPYRNII
jgi:hypothetical protein